MFDPMALQVNTIGMNNYNGGELTEIGDGWLYEFAGSPSSKLIQFDKTNAQVVETIPFNNFPLTNAFVFAFWGGDFVHAWAFAGDCDPATLTSNTFTMEWPPRSGKFAEFPEVFVFGRRIEESERG